MRFMAPSDCCGVPAGRCPLALQRRAVALAFVLVRRLGVLGRRGSGGRRGPLAYSPVCRPAPENLNSDNGGYYAEAAYYSGRATVSSTPPDVAAPLHSS
jgi:hypothetical protein